MAQTTAIDHNGYTREMILFGQLQSRVRPINTPI
jgi:hypothetical protein